MENEKQNLTIFDKRSEWKEKCQPIFDRLTELCDTYGIPYFITACISNSSTDTEYVTDALLPDVKDMQLHDDHIRKHMQVFRGYEVRIPRQDVVLTMDDIDNIPDPGEIIY